MGSFYEVSLASPISAPTFTNYADNPYASYGPQENMSEAATPEELFAPTASETSFHAPIKFLENQGWHKNLREQLAALCKKGEQICYELNRETLKGKRIIEDFQHLNAKFIHIDHLYKAISRQENNCQNLSKQQIDFQQNPQAEQVHPIELAAHLDKSLHQLERMQAEWQARANELDRACQERTILQQEYETHLGLIIPLQESKKQIWHDIENLLRQEKQNIKNIIAEGRKYPQDNQENLGAVAIFINHFEADFAQSYALLEPSIYQMLRISISVKSNFIDPLQKDFDEQELFIIDKLVWLEKNLSKKENPALNQMFSIREIIIIENILIREIKNACGKLEQEKIIDFSRNNEKIKNIIFYIQALSTSYREISEMRQEILKTENIWLGYLSGFSMSNMA